MARFVSTSSLIAHLVRASGALLIIVCLAACTATPKYGALGDAGVAYGSALDTALQVAAEREVDLNSERLVQSNLDLFAPGRTVSRDERDSLAKQLRDADAEAERTFANMADLRAHVAVFRDYFVALQALATSAAPEDAGKQAAALGSKLSDLTTSLGATIPGDQLGSALSGIAQIVVSSQINRALRQELEKRKETIFSALAVQGILMDQEIARLERADRQFRNAQILRNVQQPLVTSRISNIDDWIAKRRSILSTHPTTAALKQARAASDKFRNALKLALQGTMDLDDFRFLAQEFQGVKASLDAARKLAAEAIR